MMCSFPLLVDAAAGSASLISPLGPVSAPPGRKARYPPTLWGPGSLPLPGSLCVPTGQRRNLPLDEYSPYRRNQSKPSGRCGQAQSFKSNRETGIEQFHHEPGRTARPRNSGGASSTRHDCFRPATACSFSSRAAICLGCLVPISSSLARHPTTPRPCPRK
jgi:hypothetical protein